MMFAIPLLETLQGLIGPVFNKLIIALALLFIGFALGKLLGKFVQKLLHEVELDVLLERTLGLRFKLEHLVGSVISYFIYFITVVMALDQLGIKTEILNILSLAFLAIIVLSVFLSIKDLVPNFIAGIVLNTKKMIDVDDTISFRGTRGKVVYSSLTETRIETKGGDIIYIPNRLLTSEQFSKKKGPRKK